MLPRRLPRGAVRSAVVLAVAMGCALSAPDLDAQRVVPVHQEPRHRLVLDRPPVRLMDVQILPGDTTLFHTHESAILYVGLGASSTDSQPLNGEWRGEGSDEAPEWDPGVVFYNLEYATEPYTHRVANVGERLFRLMAVANYGPGVHDDSEWDEPSVPGEVENENPWYRQWRLRLEPGGETRTLESPNRVVGIQVTEGRAAVESEGTVSEVLNRPGEWFYREPGDDYRLRNRSDEPVTLVVVEAR